MVALLSTLQGCLGLQPAARTVHGARSVARGAHCSDRHQRLHRAPCAASTLAVHSSARHALQLRAASRCSVACALPETAQGCGSVRSTLLERCRWPAVHVVRWGFVGGSFQRTARAVNFYYFRSSVHLLAPCTRRQAHGGPTRRGGFTRVLFFSRTPLIWVGSVHHPSTVARVTFETAFAKL